MPGRVRFSVSQKLLLTIRAGWIDPTAAPANGLTEMRRPSRLGASVGGKPSRRKAFEFNGLS